MSKLGYKYGKILAMAIGVFAIGGVTQTYADPVNITSGIFNFLQFDGASMGLSGRNGAELSGEIGSANVAYTPPYACMSTTGGCAGQTVNLSVSDSLTSTPSGPSGFAVEAGMIVDGVRYSVDDLSYTISAGSITAPLTGTASAPFTFMATAVGTSATGATNTFDWTGAGTATARYGAANGWGSTDYAFSATPEPSSVVLLGPGLAVMFFLGRRRLLHS
jgi:hypothetical protein